MNDLQVHTIAGSDKVGFQDGSSRQAMLDSPGSLAIAPDGSIYFADRENYRIRVLKKDTVRTVAGCGQDGFEDGPALSARLGDIGQIALGPHGVLYIADTGNNRIRCLQSGVLQTVAGGGQQEEDGPALQVRLQSPSGMAVADDGRIFIAEHSTGYLKVLHNRGVKTLLRGVQRGGHYSSLHRPQAILAAPHGSIYISETGKNCISMVRNGEFHQLAGIGLGDDEIFAGHPLEGPALSAKLSHPAQLALGKGGELYIADEKNNRIAVLQNGVIRTLAGSGALSSLDGPALTAGFHGPNGIALHPDGSLIISESVNNRLRRIKNVVPPPQLRTLESAGLMKSSTHFTDIDLSSATATIKLHRCLASLRFPALLQSISMFESYHLGIDVMEAFRVYFYSEELPQEGSAKVYLGLAFMLQKCESPGAALDCLQRLSEVTVGRADNIESLISALGFALELGPYDDGVKVSKYLLIKHKTMAKLFETRIDADFEIVIINGQSEQEDEEQEQQGAQAVECHRVVLHARWPFFTAVLNSSMREAVEGRYEINVADMSLPVLNALLEVCYTGVLSARLREEISPIFAMQLLAARMYFKTGASNAAAEDAVDEPFGELAEFAQEVVASGLTPSNCIEIYIEALNLHIQEVEARAKAFIIGRKKEVFREEKNRVLFESLPANIMAQMFFESS